MELEQPIEQSNQKSSQKMEVQNQKPYWVGKEFFIKKTRKYYKSPLTIFEDRIEIGEAEFKKTLMLNDLIGVKKTEDVEGEASFQIIGFPRRKKFMRKESRNV